ncbi:MAG: UDP-N-acetylmuramoyl-tripeptide--D-alanyl-D-alanine ligase [Salibacteraceae bacterium]|nr:UDP-N-acetylmuramoyl-tripeptide--D-alanyl-D-alanine ligase [Salibacteraceae bacterium]
MNSIQNIYRAFLQSSGINTDTRTLKPGQMFFALKGDNFNGNDFAIKALNEGCSYVVADEDRIEFKSEKNIIVVESVLKTLQQLAHHHRIHLKIPIIGLTGSNGKTTSKELLKAALSKHYNCYATKGNLNNHIGVPLSVLEINVNHEIAVIEMGANHQKEIELLCSICTPDSGYITNIGLAHLEGFGGEEGVYKGKKELFDFLSENGSTIFVNEDDPKVVRAVSNLKTIGYGKSATSIYQGNFELNQEGLKVFWWRNNDKQLVHEIQTNLTGSYNFSNVLSAVAVARYYGVSPEKIKAGIEEYIPTNNRSQVIKTELGNTVIVDCYNANPSSMLAALENVELRTDSKKFLILGDMLEIGDLSESKHREILVKANEIVNTKTFLVGPEFGKVSDGKASHFEKTESLKAFISENPITQSLVLLKGSRKMKLEQMLELL